MTDGGFPDRPTRDAWGEPKVDAFASPVAAEYTSDDEFNLTFGQVSGMGLVCGRGFALIDGATGDLLQSGEAWDQNGLYLPTSSKEATGHYRLAYLATYPNRKGEEVAINLTCAAASCGSASARHPTFVMTNTHQVEIYTWDAAGNAADVTSLLVQVF